MKRFQYTVWSGAAWNTGAIEQWLEHKAAQGWRLYHCGNRLIRFERAEPAACRVRVQPRKPEEFADDWQERTAVYRELGWDYAAELGEEYEVFYCSDPDAPELESDPAVQKWAWEKSLKRSWRNGWLLLLAYAGLTAWWLWIILAASNPVSALVENAKTPAVLCVPVLLFCMFMNIFRRLWSVYRTRRLLAAGIAPPHTGNWKRMRRLDVLTFACSWLLWATVLIQSFAPILTDHSWTWEEAPQPLPCVAAETLDPALTASRREYGWVDLDRSLLAPEQYDILEVYPEQVRVQTTYESLLASALAGPLYREKLAGFREQWPDAALTVLGRENFDQAALLDSGPEGTVQHLLIRRGNVVLTVWTNAGIDLAEHLDDYARLLAEFQGGGKC